MVGPGILGPGIHFSSLEGEASDLVRGRPFWWGRPFPGSVQYSFPGSVWFSSGYESMEGRRSCTPIL
nr:hypothetical protein Q903MT_gene2312 [Picea sitchensis]